MVKSRGIRILEKNDRKGFGILRRRKLSVAGFGGRLNEGQTVLPLKRKGLVKISRRRPLKTSLNTSFKDSVANRLLKVIELYDRMFLEQSINDLGTTPMVPVNGNEDEFFNELNNETVGKGLEELENLLREKGLDVSISDDQLKVSKDDKSLVISFTVHDGEPQLLLTSNETEVKMTISLVPYLGAVEHEGKIFDMIRDDEEFREELVNFILSVFEGEHIEDEADEVEGDFKDVIDDEISDEDEDEDDKDDEDEDEGFSDNDNDISVEVSDDEEGFTDDDENERQ